MEEFEGTGRADDGIELALGHGGLADACNGAPPPVAELGAESLATAEKSPRVVEQGGHVGAHSPDNGRAVIEEAVETGLDQIDESHAIRHEASLMAAEGTHGATG
ncbi:hypothetical protein GCM10022286_01690 [Gryllotalpicola daejeonensis]|uniref:Uncharacterized protein n=1 Tax=Gryllotalpicola daejeonensis TaxID=993087 RepID=A0ABP7ZDF3_9MICO